MTAIAYRVTGGYDADTEVLVGVDGAFTVEAGGYRTRGRREGRLSRRQQAALDRLAEAVALRDWPVPAGAEGFVHTLQVGDQHARWWGPTTDVDAALARLTDALTTLPGR